MPKHPSHRTPSHPSAAPIITTTSGGRVEFRVCPRSTNIDEACFGTNYLTSADTGERSFWLMTGTYSNSAPYTVKYRLPAGVSCPNGCVIQWK